MANRNLSAVNKPYIVSVTALIIIFPAVSVVIENYIDNSEPVSFALIGKWFIFYAVGLRLFIAGARQILAPSFTARDIFHIEDKASYPIVRELGIANICFGLVGILSLFLPQWRIVSAFGSGLFYGIAGLNHFIKKPVSANETFALVSDIVIFLVLLIYFGIHFNWFI